MTRTGYAFQQLLSRLELNPTRRALASQRYNAVKTVIEGCLPGTAVKQIGSFQRQTKIRPINLSDDLDVDALVVAGDFVGFVPSGRGGVTTGDALDGVMRALRSSGTYELMEPTSDAPAIVLEYHDGFKLEIAVGYRDRTGARPTPTQTPCYLVAGRDGVWLPSDYDNDARIITSLNQTVAGGKLVPTIKVLKHLFRTHQVPVGSFHTEILVALVLPPAIHCWNAAGCSWGIEHAVAECLTSAGSVLRRPIALPGSCSLPVGIDAGFTSKVFVHEYLYSLGKLAWNACKAPERDAISAWRAILGDVFPSEAAAA